jgi:uncharacterized repeat protein (TIGR01451 family)
MRARWTKAGVALALVLGTSGLARPAGAFPFADDFNRADSTDLGANWAETGTDLAISANLLTNPAQSAGFATVVGGGSGSVVEADVATGAGTNLQYAALALDVVTSTNNVFVKVQDNNVADGTAAFNRVFFYRGNAGDPLTAPGDPYFFDVTPFTTGHMRVTSNGATVTAILNTDLDPEPEFTRTVAVASPPGGTGVGLGASGGSRLDNFSSNDLPPAGPADVTVSKTGAPDPVAKGRLLTYTITVTNLTAFTRSGVISLTDRLPANTAFVSWSGTFPYSDASGTRSGPACSTPVPDFGGTVVCTGSLDGAGDTSPSAVFTLVVKVAKTTTAPTVSNTAKVSLSGDPNSDNNSASATTTLSSGTPSTSSTTMPKPPPCRPKGSC